MYTIKPLTYYSVIICKTIIRLIILITKKLPSSIFGLNSLKYDAATSKI